MPEVVFDKEHKLDEAQRKVRRLKNKAKRAIQTKVRRRKEHGRTTGTSS